MVARIAGSLYLLAILSSNIVAQEQITITDEVEVSKDRKTDQIVERYPSGQAKVERSVAQDDEGNFIQHGKFRMYRENGQLMVQGNYDKNNRVGVWNRWYHKNEIKLLERAPYNQYPGPFISQATFKNGQLDGYWIIFDAKHNKISQILFKEGERHGTATWWHLNGHKSQEFTYKDGSIHGLAQRWNDRGIEVSKEIYKDGRRLSTKVETYRSGSKKKEGRYLEPALVLAEHDDWMNGKTAKYSTYGDAIRHGTWKTYHPNGKLESTGHFEMGGETGSFSWFYSNGQKKIQGDYIDGKQNGKWTWWHENGQQKIAGGYHQGNPSDAWTWWSPKGEVTQRAEFGGPETLEAIERRNLANDESTKPGKEAAPKLKPLEEEKGPELRSAKQEPPLLPIRK